MTRPLPSLLFIIALLVLGLPSRATNAATELASEPEPGIELLVIEARGCPMCQLLRDEIAPIYRGTTRARRAPLRFVDVAHADLDSMGLASPVEIIPTIILMREGAEVDRLVGYTGPDIFMRAVGVMLGESPQTASPK